jgi:hypothetical protein
MPPSLSRQHDCLRPQLGQQHGLEFGRQSGLSSERSAIVACERAGRCAWRDIHRAVGGQRPRAHVVSSCVNASSAQAPRTLPTGTLPPPAYAIVAASAVPPLLLQLQPPMPAAGAQALRSTGLTALRSCHRAVRGPADVSRALLTARSRGVRTEEPHHCHQQPPNPAPNLSAVKCIFGLRTRSPHSQARARARGGWAWMYVAV